STDRNQFKDLVLRLRTRRSTGGSGSFSERQTSLSKRRKLSAGHGLPCTSTTRVDALSVRVVTGHRPLSNCSQTSVPSVVSCSTAWIRIKCASQLLGRREGQTAFAFEQFSEAAVFRAAGATNDFWCDAFSEFT